MSAKWIRYCQAAAGAFVAISLAPGRAVAQTSPEDCARRVGPDWVKEITKQQREGGHFTALIFLESATAKGTAGNLCFYNRDYGVVGDPIYVAVFRKDVT